MSVCTGHLDLRKSQSSPRDQSLIGRPQRSASLPESFTIREDRTSFGAHDFEGWFIWTITMRCTSTARRSRSDSPRAALIDGLRSMVHPNYRNADAPVCKVVLLQRVNHGNSRGGKNGFRFDRNCFSVDQTGPLGCLRRRRPE